MRRVLLLALAVVVVAAVVFGVVQNRRKGDEGPSSTAVTPLATPPVRTLTATPTPAQLPATPSAASSTSALNGQALARAWLAAFLTRATRDDTSWADAVTPLCTPELLVDLRTAGPDLVGLNGLSTWRVTKVEPFEPIDPPVDTESRQLLAYAATVTDGTHTVEKPFELYAYLQPDGRWLIGMVDQPYSSEG